MHFPCHSPGRLQLHPGPGLRMTVRAPHLCNAKVVGKKVKLKLRSMRDVQLYAQIYAIA